MNLDPEDLSLTGRKTLVADLLILACTIFVFGWIAAALVWLAKV
jgi:hypothetical protein